jgi:hypothetical protein
LKKKRAGKVLIDATVIASISSISCTIDCILFAEPKRCPGESPAVNRFNGFFLDDAQFGDDICGGFFATRWPVICPTEFARLEDNWRPTTSGSTRFGTNFSKCYGAKLNAFSSSFEFRFVHRVRVSKLSV